YRLCSLCAVPQFHQTFQSVTSAVSTSPVRRSVTFVFPVFPKRLKSASEISTVLRLQVVMWVFGAFFLADFFVFFAFVTNFFPLVTGIPRSGYGPAKLYAAFSAVSYIRS